MTKLSDPEVFIAVLAAIIIIALLASGYFTWFIYDLMKSPPKLGAIIQPIRFHIPFTKIEIFRYPKNEFVFTVPGARSDAESDDDDETDEYPPEVGFTPTGFKESKRITKPRSKLWNDVIGKAKENDWNFKQTKKYVAETYPTFYANAGDIERSIRDAAKTRNHKFEKESSLNNPPELS